MLVLSSPAIFSLELTPLCNNRCYGCNNNYADSRDLKPMPASSWKSILESLITEAVQIRLTGGEPTLHSEFFDILDISTSYSAWVTIFTNGRWWSPRVFLKKLRNYPNLTGLLISLHGAHPQSHEAFTGVRNSFITALANIQLAIDSGIKVALSTIITKHNWNELDEVLELGQKLGVNHIAFNRYLGRPLPNIECDKDQLLKAVESIEKMIQAGMPVTYGICMPQCFAPNRSEGCLAGVAYISIDPWGNVRPCAHSPSVIGSLHDYSMEKLWHSEKMHAWRSMMPDECTSCAAYATCHGGCRAIQELRPDRRDPLRRQPLRDFSLPEVVNELPVDGRPKLRAKLRQESFGYVLLGAGHLIPVAAQAHPLVEACDGNSTFAELSVRFGQSGLNLLGEMMELGMLEIN